MKYKFTDKFGRGSNYLHCWHYAGRSMHWNPSFNELEKLWVEQGRKQEFVHCAADHFKEGDRAGTFWRYYGEPESAFRGPYWSQEEAMYQCLLCEKCEADNADS